MPKMCARLSCGRDFHCVPDINTALDTACKSGFDFLCLPLVNPRYRREFINGPAKKRPGALTRSDMVVSSQDWSSLIVGKVSPWLQNDSKIDTVRKNSDAALRQELKYAAHLGMPAIMVPLKSRNILNLARCLNEHMLCSYFQQQFWMQVPLVAPWDQRDDVIEGLDGGDSPTEDTWEWWHLFRTLCDCNKRLGICLEMTADLPSESVLERWLSEPIKTVSMSTNLFLTNKKGYPVLSKAHQSFLRRLFRLDVQLILTGVDRHPDKGIRAYQQYLDHLWQNQTPPDAISQFARGYEDYLQSPLQPLMDNLESQTYEIFEKDPIKYSQYQKAIYYALLDKIKPDEKDTKSVIVMVVGAGRGPLVRAAIAAASQADRKIKKLYAVEKNPNAVVTLENLKDEMWGEQVDVISCDMRFWEAPEQTDILVSELLGSFGDNELSPECLDGAQRFLKDDGISIPCKYTSYLAPIQSAKLYNEVRQCKEKDKGPEVRPFEMPCVVSLHNCQLLSEPQKVFTFVHPNKDEVIDNSRYKSLDFTISNDCVLHGFAGYFDCVLFAHVTLSIVPATHSPGMFSWFPILFPIKRPLLLKGESQVVLDIWRLCTDKNVWYEWAVQDPIALSIHNPKGRSYTIGL
ncbi:LOW QUALITY PROTEIN: protein arginine N-methyltransferase 5-like [Haliotis rubra]|uniref:LOW QUALITY PROTEIN: protein arginine N-methyltransferase 5-like n=1 Tax=Haliotis rubra TaxID=36100 RepID=UPI001EE57552|nr:LOW QUALITY PROTEIN: protein arginine N-methyltransferase 5-like [Haliotis rubra]